MSSKCPIVFGPLTKMLLIPFILALNQILYNIFILFYNYETSQIIESLSISTGHMLNAVIPHIKFFSTEGKGLSSKRITLKPKKAIQKMVFPLLVIRLNISWRIIFIRSSSYAKFRFGISVCN